MPLSFALLALTAPATPVDLAPFAHISHAVAVANRETANRHLNQVVARMEGDANFAWYCRQERALAAWANLALAMNETAPLAAREEYLRRLRQRIGDDAFRSGTMPAAVPSYQYPPLAKRD